MATYTNCTWSLKPLLGSWLDITCLPRDKCDLHFFWRSTHSLEKPLGTPLKSLMNFHLSYPSSTQKSPPTSPRCNSTLQYCNFVALQGPRDAFIFGGKKISYKKMPPGFFVLNIANKILWKKMMDVMSVCSKAPLRSRARDIFFCHVCRNPEETNQEIYQELQVGIYKK